MKNLNYQEYKQIINFYKKNVLFVMDEEDFNEPEDRQELMRMVPTVQSLLKEYSACKKNYSSVERYLAEYQIG
tara:strand:+ start:262 stop:480 length:219 start_codon:yes stop_codon:yes gene_type:complete